MDGANAVAPEAAVDQPIAPSGGDTRLEPADTVDEHHARRQRGVAGRRDRFPIRVFGLDLVVDLLFGFVVQRPKRRLIAVVDLPWIDAHSEIAKHWG